MDKIKKYVQVGCGSRGIFAYSKNLVNDYADCAKLCGVYDINIKRAKLVSEIVGQEIPVYEDFDEMIKDVKPDVVIVTTVDAFHDEYIIKALYAGCDVISEKPLTTTFEKALAIKKAEEETGKKVTVTFNLRYQPLFKRLKEIVAAGTIGKILSIHYEWMLDTDHGASYFRRWHRERKNSGSLLVHKSTHHFDLANWFLEEDPIAVNAYGSLRYYGHTRENRAERCLDCPYKKECEFYFDINKDENIRKMYLNCEDVDGYYRDACVFSDKIDIEDTVSVNVLYSGGAVMSYSLTAHSPYEGITLNLNGTEGRLEYIYKHDHSDHIINIYNRNGEKITITPPYVSEDGHSGADEPLRDSLFRDENVHDPLGQKADNYKGMMSIGIGMAANISMKENRRVYLNEFYDFDKRS